MSNKPQDADSKQPDSSFIQLDDAKQKGAASAASAPRRKALVGVLTAVSIVLIVVSLGFVQPSASGAWSIDWIAQAVAGKSVAENETETNQSAPVTFKATDTNASTDADIAQLPENSQMPNGEEEAKASNVIHFSNFTEHKN